MKLSPDFAQLSLRLLLLAQLLVLSWSRPPTTSICVHLKLMYEKMRILNTLTRNLKNKSEISSIMEYKLDSLPEMTYRTNHLRSLKLNDTLSQLYKDLSLFELHILWLTKIQGDRSPSGLEDEVVKGLQQLLHLCYTTLEQISCPIPLISDPSFPTQLKTWDVALLSNEIPQRLLFYCDWSTRVLYQLRLQAHCR